MPERANTLYIIMGVSGCGKSTIGKMLAEKINVPFYDGDDFHPNSNIEKMASGLALDDSDRWPWLMAINQFAAEELGRTSIVIACSALKQKYRDLIAEEIPIEFIYLKGTKELIQQRLSKREGHFMPPKLLESQFQTLEEPEDAISVDISLPAEIIVSGIIAQIA